MQDRILADERMVSQALQGGRKVVHTYRRVEVWLPDQEETLVLLTNLSSSGRRPLPEKCLATALALSNAVPVLAVPGEARAKPNSWQQPHPESS